MIAGSSRKQGANAHQRTQILTKDIIRAREQNLSTPSKKHKQELPSESQQQATASALMLLDDEPQIMAATMQH